MARIFGWELSFGRRNRPRLPLVSPFQLVDQEPEGGADPKKPKKSWVDSPVLTYANQGTGGFRRSGRASLVSVGPEYDLVELGRAEDVDSYLNQSFLKKTALMFKEGFDYVGANPRTIEYLRTRFDQIANATGIPHEELLHRMGGYLIRRSNAFLIKVRNPKASGGNVRKSRKGKRLDPVAGYYPAPPEMMEADLDEHGQVRLWRQRTPSGSFVEFSPEDVIHFTFNRKEGFVFGTPVAVPVLDDIRALRRIEENIELLVYHHLFPIFHYKVGTPEQPCGLTEDGKREVEVAKTELQLMPAEGGIVTSERHEIKLLGSESRALRAEPYVEHFKKRVFAGLGMSAIDYGEGESSNRSCYSEDTETLTESGWKFYWQVTEDDKIATFNPVTDHLEFQKPIGGLRLYDYAGEMVHFKNRNVDVLVTPDHDMWVGQPTWSRGLNWEKIHADKISQRMVQFRTGGLGWEGEEPEDFLLPHVPYSYHSHFPNTGPFSRIPIKDWLEFLGYFLSEGCLAKKKGSWPITISQNSIVNKGKAERIRACLERLPFKFNEYTNPKDHTTRFWINCKSLYLYLQENCGDYSYLKHLPQEILTYSKEFLRVVFEALMLGDGTTDKRPGRTSRAYYSTSDLLLDQVQEIALKLGYRAHILAGSGCGRVVISEGDTSKVTRDWTQRVNYSGKVYCFSVPNHLFITRRNGRIGIHGNTAESMSLALIDSVKHVQDVLESQWYEFILRELLLESSFGEDALKPENRVILEFREIDLDKQVKVQTHAADQFSKQAITHDELRKLIGRQPWQLPVQGEETDPKKLVEWNRSHWKLFHEPELLIRAIDEKFQGAATEAVMESPSTGMTPEDVKAAEERKKSELKTQAALKLAARSKSKPVKRKDNFLGIYFDAFEEALIEELRKDNISTGIIAAKREMLERRMVDNLASRMHSTFLEQMGIQAATGEFLNVNIQSRDLFHSRAALIVGRLMRDAERLALRNSHLDGVERVAAARAAISSIRYRVRFINDVEAPRAGSWGRAIRGSIEGRDGIQFRTLSGACENCLRKAGAVLPLDRASLEDMAPHHAECHCEMVMVNTGIRADSVEDSEISDADKLERCVLRVKGQLRTKNPGMSEKGLKRKAFAICQASLNK